MQWEEHWDSLIALQVHIYEIGTLMKASEIGLVAMLTAMCLKWHNKS